MNQSFDSKKGIFPPGNAAGGKRLGNTPQSPQAPQSAAQGNMRAAAAQANTPNAPVEAAAGAAPASAASRTGTALLVGVFLLSAAVGGGMAGLYLAMQKGEAPSSIAAQTEENTETGAAVIAAAPASGGQPKKDEERLVPAAAKPAATAAQPTMAPAGAAASSQAPAPSKPPATAGEPVQAGATELKALTENVVAALSALNSAPEEKDIAQVEADAERLRNSLAELVNVALTQGKSEAEVRELIAAALEDAGEGNIPGILRDASGKLNLQKLLASIMPQDAARDMPMSAQERAYFEQLVEEADNEVVIKPAGDNKRTPAKTRKPQDRFFYENGTRYTIVRRGDTLSDIAYAAYGDVLAYPAILRANRGRISTRRLKPGTRIVVPELPRKTRKARNKKRSAAPVSLIRRAANAPNKAKAEQLLARKKAAPAKAAANAQQNIPAEAAVPAGGKTVITNFRPARLKAEAAPLSSADQQ